MVSIPTTEPAQLNAGDTWQWTRVLADYPQPTWVLSYYLRHEKEDQPRVIVATDGGDGVQSIAVAAADSKAYIGGRWTWVARVTDGTTVTTIERGVFDIRADFADIANDFRTYNERCLDAIEAVRENRASTDQSQWAIEGRSVSRLSPDELERMWKKFKELVARERGVKSGTIRVRM